MFAGGIQGMIHCWNADEKPFTLKDLNEDGKPETYKSWTQYCTEGGPYKEKLFSESGETTYTYSETIPRNDVARTDPRYRSQSRDYLRFVSEANLYHANNKVFHQGDAVTCQGIYGRLEEVAYRVNEINPTDSQRIVHLYGIPEDIDLAKCTVTSDVATLLAKTKRLADELRAKNPDLKTLVSTTEGKRIFDRLILRTVDRALPKADVYGGKLLASRICQELGMKPESALLDQIFIHRAIILAHQRELAKLETGK